MRPDTLRIWRESNQVGIQFLRTELKAGHTFLDIAGGTDVETTRLRTARVAKRAYDRVAVLMPRLNLSISERDELKGKLEDLKRRLESNPK